MGNMLSGKGIQSKAVQSKAVQSKVVQSKAVQSMKMQSMNRYIFLLKTLLFSYIITGGLLLLLAFMLYKFKLQETIVTIGIIGIYIIATFFAGFVTGKKVGEKKFLWGFLIGSVYFLILLVVSLCVNESSADIANDLLTTFFMCAGSGMLGGMLS